MLVWGAINSIVANKYAKRLEREGKFTLAILKTLKDHNPVVG